MNNIDIVDTQNTNTTTLAIYILIGVVIVAFIIWYAYRPVEEKFTNKLIQKQNNVIGNINKLVKNQAEIHEHNNTEISENTENTLVNFAEDNQKLVNNYHPNNVYKNELRNNGDFHNLTADDKTIALMNQIDSDKNIDDVACNLYNNLSEEDKNLIANYKNKYYNMYAHQISCGNRMGNLSGCGKKCYANGMSPVNCAPEDLECQKHLNELNNNADFVALNQLILEKNNNRSCSTCTQKPILSRAVGVQSILDQVTNYDNVSASFMDSQLLDNVNTKEHFSNNNEEELKKKDNELVKKKKVSFANINNLANFKNYVNQNGVLETSVDKIAEIRSDTTNNATCKLNEYGQNIADVYDNLMKNPYMEYKKACNTSKINGVLEDTVNNYQGNGNFGGNYGGEYANL
jgi:hypothetical protein